MKREPKEFGYCRISKPSQKISRQVENISKAYPNAEIIEEAYTGTKVQGRKAFEKLLDTVEAGDTIIFDSVSRMSRNAEEGFTTYKQLFDKGVNLIFLKEPNINTEVYRAALDKAVQVEIDTEDNDANELVTGIFAAVNRFMWRLADRQIQLAFEQAQKEVDDLHTRTSEGLREAKKKGKRIGTEKGRKLTTKKSIKAKEFIRKRNKNFGGDLTNEETWKLCGISKMTFYKYQNELIAEMNQVQET